MSAGWFSSVLSAGRISVLLSSVMTVSGMISGLVRSIGSLMDFVLVGLLDSRDAELALILVMCWDFLPPPVKALVLDFLLRFDILSSFLSW